MCISVFMHVHVCIMHVGALGGQAKVSDPLESELRTVMSAGIGTQVPCKSSQCS